MRSVLVFVAGVVAFAAVATASIDKDVLLTTEVFADDGQWWLALTAHNLTTGQSTSSHPATIGKGVSGKWIGSYWNGTANSGLGEVSVFTAVHDAAGHQTTYVDVYDVDVTSFPATFYQARHTQLECNPIHAYGAGAAIYGLVPQTNGTWNIMWLDYNAGVCWVIQNVEIGGTSPATFATQEWVGLLTALRVQGNKLNIITLPAYPGSPDQPAVFQDTVSLPTQVSSVIAQQYDNQTLLVLAGSDVLAINEQTSTVSRLLTTSSPVDWLFEYQDNNGNSMLATAYTTESGSWTVDIYSLATKSKVAQSPLLRPAFPHSTVLPLYLANFAPYNPVATQ